MTPREAIRQACDNVGGPTALGRMIGVPQPTIWMWCNRTQEGCAPKYVLAIERATGVSKHDLRPDLYPREDAA